MQHVFIWRDVDRTIERVGERQREREGRGDGEEERNLGGRKIEGDAGREGGQKL